MIKLDGDVAAVSGSMTMTAAAALLEEGCNAIDDEARIFDLAAVTEVDSSGLAVLFAWLRAARSQNQELQFRNLPASLDSLAAVYDVVDLLPRH